MKLLLTDLLPQLFDRPRDPAEVERLAQSLRAEGQLVPIRVVKVGTRWRIVEGGTRAAAARYLGWPEIEAVAEERELSAFEELRQCFTANEARSGFTPLQRAELFQRLLQEGNLTGAELAAKLGISPSEVTKVLAISRNLIGPLKELVESSKLSASIAYLMSRLPEEVQKSLAPKATELRRETVEGLVARHAGARPKPVKPVQVKDGPAVVTLPGQWTLAQGLEWLSKVSEAMRKCDKLGLPAATLPSVFKGA